MSLLSTAVPANFKLVPVYTGGSEPLLSRFPPFEEPAIEGLPCPKTVLCGQKLISLSFTRQAAVNLWQPVGRVDAVAANSADVSPATPRRVNANTVTVLQQIGRSRSQAASQVGPCRLEEHGLMFHEDERRNLSI